MSTVTTPLTIAQFRAQYGDSDRIEFWAGEVVEKAMPTHLHSLTQIILGILLWNAGYRAGSEMRLRIGDHFEPLPDVAAGRKRVSADHPTSADEIEIVAEIVSPTDRNRDIRDKCRFYQSIGIARIYVVNPVDRKGYLWDSASDSLLAADEWHLPNGRTLRLTDVWAKIDEDEVPE